MSVSHEIAPSHSTLTFMQNAARSAGKLLIEGQQNLKASQVKLKGPTNLVTTYDIQCEELLISHIRRLFPSDEILAEESKNKLDIKSIENKRIWIIDPIDGTTNFTHKIPYFAISIAYFFDGKVQFGVVYNPMTDDMYFSMLGKGAWKIKDKKVEKLHASNAMNLNEVVVVTGFPYTKQDEIDDLMKRLRVVLLSAQEVRRFGGASLDCCQVAEGKLGAYYECVEPWDMAAGGLIAREAGAKTGNYLPVDEDIPSDIRSRRFLCAGKGVFDAMKQMLAQA